VADRLLPHQRRAERLHHRLVRIVFVFVLVLVLVVEASVVEVFVETFHVPANLVHVQSRAHDGGTYLLERQRLGDVGSPLQVRFALSDTVPEQALDILTDFFRTHELSGMHHELLQRSRKVPGRLIAPIGVLSQRAHHDGLEIRRVVREHGRRRRDDARLHALHRLEIGIHAEQSPPRGQLPKHDAECKDVGAAVDVPAADLLRGHVRDLAFERPGLGVRQATRDLGDAEVHHLDDAIVGDEQIVRGDVAMHEVERATVLSSQLVRGVQSFGRIGDDPRRQGRLQRGTNLHEVAQHFAQRLAMEVLHRNPMRVLMTTEIEYLGHVRMRDARRNPCLIEKHLDDLFVLDEVGMDPLDGDPLLEPPGPIHPAKVHGGHAPHADVVHHAVTPDEVRPRVRRLGCLAASPVRARRPRRCFRGRGSGHSLNYRQVAGIIVTQRTAPHDRQSRGTHECRG